MRRTLWVGALVVALVGRAEAGSSPAVASKTTAAAHGSGNRDTTPSAREDAARVGAPVARSTGARAKGSSGFARRLPARGATAEAHERSAGPESGVSTPARPPSLRSADARSQTELGLPTTATRGDRDDLLFARHGFVGSYNAAKRGPNWVSYKVSRETYAGESERGARRDLFRPDDDFPRGVRTADNADFRNEPFDRGHNKRAGDAPGDRASNRATYLYSNVTPHAANVNRGPFFHHEIYQRSLATAENKTVRVVVGSVFSATSRTIGKGVAVPDYVFRLVVASDAGTPVSEMSSKNTFVTAVLIPNDDSLVGQGDHFAKFVTSPGEIVRKTGFTGLLSGLPAGFRREVFEHVPQVERVAGGYRVDDRFVAERPRAEVTR